MHSRWIAGGLLAAGLSLVVGLALTTGNGGAPAARAQEPQCGEDINCVVVTKDTNPETDDVEFEFDSNAEEGDFFLMDDGSMVLTTEGTEIEIIETVTDGWTLTDISCTEPAGVEVIEDEGEGTVTVDFSGLDEGEFEEVQCTFTNEQDEEETPTATATATQTPTPTATATATGTVSPTATATSTPTTVPPVVTQPPSVISPPTTGDGGLKD